MRGNRASGNNSFCKNNVGTRIRIRRISSFIYDNGLVVSYQTNIKHEARYKVERKDRLHNRSFLSQQVGSKPMSQTGYIFLCGLIPNFRADPLSALQPKLSDVQTDLRCLRRVASSVKNCHRDFPTGILRLSTLIRTPYFVATRLHIVPATSKTG